MLSDFYMGFVKMQILHHAALEPVYGLALIAELRWIGYHIGPDTLYPMPHQLETDRFLLQREVCVVNGQNRTYYTSTGQRRATLAEARTRIIEMRRTRQ